MLLELAGEEALPLRHLLVPGLQDPLPLPGLQIQSVRVGLLNVRADPLQAVDVLQLPTDHAHQKLVERVVVHEVVVPPDIVRHSTLLAVGTLVVCEEVVV